MNLDFKLSFLERFGDSDTQDIIAALRREQALADQLAEALRSVLIDEFGSVEDWHPATAILAAWEGARRGS